MANLPASDAWRLDRRAPMRRFSARPGTKSKRNRERFEGEEPAEPPGPLPRIGTAHRARRGKADRAISVGKPGVGHRAPQQIARRLHRARRGDGGALTQPGGPDPSQVSKEGDRELRDLEVRVEPPHPLSERGAAAISAQAAASRDQVMPRREQRTAIVQVEAAERIHPASFRDVEVKLAGRAIERGAREEPPAQMRLPSCEEVEPLTYLHGDALVVNLGIGVAALPEGGRARAQIQLGVLRPPRSPRVESEPRLSVEALS